MPAALLGILVLATLRRYLSADNGPAATNKALQGVATLIEHFVDPHRPAIARRNTDVSAPSPAATTPAAPTSATTTNTAPVSPTVAATNAAQSVATAIAEKPTPGSAAAARLANLIPYVQPVRASGQTSGR